MVSKRDWLDIGLRVLAREGAPALTVERLSGRLGVTKGSFYHHFKGMAGFKVDLLAHFEAECTTGYIEQAERGGGTARERFERLLELVLADEEDRPLLESAMRAWAMQDADVRATQERVDQERIGYLARLCAEVGPADEALPAARLLYFVLIGSGHVLPPVGPAELREIYALTTRLGNWGKG
ncbi:TetR/AcrR family transcriptional regulator [Actinosynnema sp. CS-041913]|uniref:TetR/AcrR family transcriptional regulator n=1 Tax=Actinosynnema sp. CS-041913 TaxID=3239917 RepID=UPI003D8CE938